MTSGGNHGVCEDAAAAPGARKQLSRTISAPVLGGGSPRVAMATPPSPRRLPVLPPKGGGARRGDTTRKLPPLGEWIGPGAPNGDAAQEGRNFNAAASQPSSRGDSR